MKSKLGAALLGCTLLFAAATPAVAHDRCEHRIFKAEQNLRRAERRHGVHSREAAIRRDQLMRARAGCRYYR